jgi:two-component system, OmpR family, KDP operon response regulator KdpE
MTQQRILIADDEEPMRRLIMSNLKASGYRVQTAADGNEALQLIDEHQFDLLLLDVNMPGPNGFEVLAKVRSESSTPILMVSGRSRERDRVSALDLGADDYLNKPFGVLELVARVRALLRRGGRGPAGPLAPYRYQGLEVDFGARVARLNRAEVSLTMREFEVLAYLARNAGKVLLHRQVLQAVWGGQYGEETDFVRTFVQRIRARIEPDRTEPRYIVTHLGVGYRMPAPDSDAWSDGMRGCSCVAS